MPFCPFICEFCYFGKQSFNKNLYDKYINALKKEILMFDNHPDIKDREVTAIYIGGGTGSIINPKDFKDIFDLLKNTFPIVNNPEVSIESHPLTLNENKLMHYKKYGVNRICIGVQSFNLKNLTVIGRQNHYQINEKIINSVKEIGFDKIAIDIIYRFPEQTMGNLLHDLKMAVALSPDQISVYSLELRGTSLEKYLEKMPTEEQDKVMYFYIKEFLEKNAYIQYGQCDYAKLNKFSTYSTNVWRTPQQITLGFGAAAYSDYFGNYSWTNIYQVEKYIDVVNNKEFPGIIGIEFSKEELMARYMVLGCRSIQIDKNNFKIMFNETVDNYFKNQLTTLFGYGWIIDSGDAYQISRNGLYYINNIAKMFFSDDNKNKRQPKHQNLNNFSPSYKNCNLPEGCHKNE